MNDDTLVPLHVRPDRSHMLRPYLVPGVLELDRDQPSPDGCDCTWHAMNDDPFRLLHLDKHCPHHGWVETPVGALGSCLAYAGRVNVPLPVLEPIRRLRYSLRWQPDTPTVRAATADVRLLVLWLVNIWCPQSLLDPQRELGDLIDWTAPPVTAEEEATLRVYD